MTLTITKKERITDLSALGGLPLSIAVLISFLILIPPFGIAYLIAFLSAYVLTFTVRIIWFKNRPKAEKHNTLLERFEASSFPSLHTMRAMIHAMFLSLYFQKWILTILFFIVVGGVAYARTALKRHDGWDVIGGAIAGVILSALSYFLFF